MFVFAHIQKTGGQTVRSLLRNHFGPRLCELYNSPDLLREDDWSWLGRFYPRLAALSGHACMPYTFLAKQPEARMFTFLRDPIKRAASSYQYGFARNRDMPPFEQWVVDTGNLQTRMLAGSADLDRALEVLETRVAFVGLTERFNESLLLWRHWMQMPDFDCRYRAVNVAGDNQIKEDVLTDPVKHEMLAEHNQLDIKLLDHVREKRYPLQQQAFGPGLDAAIASFEASLEDAPAWTAASLIGRAKRNAAFRPLWKRRIRRRKPNKDDRDRQTPSAASPATTE